MTTMEMTAESFATEVPADTNRTSFKHFKEWVMDIVHGVKYEEQTHTANTTFPNQYPMTPTFSETHLPDEVRFYEIDYPFGD